MTVSISGTGGVTFNDSSVQDTAATGFGFKNRIINGAMVIDQRAAGASTTITNNGYYSCDRWKTYCDPISKYAVQQNAGAVTPPVGFSKYLGITSASSYSVGAGDYFWLEQSIEGNNVQDLAWGTASAATVTLSFWVRSSLTGQFGGSLTNAGRVRAYPFSYTISAANTWEQKTITVAGDTSGTWATGNTAGLLVIFDLGSGSTFLRTAGSWGGDALGSTGDTKIVATSGATFYITGVQLEKGSTATSFDYRPYGTELQLAQRYFQQITGGALGVTYTTTAANWGQAFPVQMRAAPTCAVSAALAVDEVGTATRTQSSANIGTTGSGVSPEAFNVFTGNFSSFTAGRPLALLTTGGKFTFTAEL
jgi:hypothetical protein